MLGVVVCFFLSLFEYFFSLFPDYFVCVLFLISSPIHHSFENIFFLLMKFNSQINKYVTNYETNFVLIIIIFLLLFFDVIQILALNSNWLALACACVCVRMWQKNKTSAIKNNFIRIFANRLLYRLLFCCLSFASRF